MMCAAPYGLYLSFPTPHRFLTSAGDVSDFVSNSLEPTGVPWPDGGFRSFELVGVVVGVPDDGFRSCELVGVVVGVPVGVGTVCLPVLVKSSFHLALCTSNETSEVAPKLLGTKTPCGAAGVALALAGVVDGKQCSIIIVSLNCQISDSCPVKKNVNIVKCRS